MGRLILTGISKGRHNFELDYREVNGITQCFAKCACGFERELHSFQNPGGTKELQIVWEKHIASEK